MLRSRWAIFFCVSILWPTSEAARTMEESNATSVHLATAVDLPYRADSLDVHGETVSHGSDCACESYCANVLQREMEKVRRDLETMRSSLSASHEKLDEQQRELDKLRGGLRPSTASQPNNGHTRPELAENDITRPLDASGGHGRSLLQEVDASAAVASCSKGEVQQVSAATYTRTNAPTRMDARAPMAGRTHYTHGCMRYRSWKQRPNPPPTSSSRSRRKTRNVHRALCSARNASPHLRPDCRCAMCRPTQTFSAARTDACTSTRTCATSAQVRRI